MSLWSPWHQVRDKSITRIQWHQLIDKKYNKNTSWLKIATKIMCISDSLYNRVLI